MAGGGGEPLGAWRLRSTGSVTRRANSVWTFADPVGGEDARAQSDRIDEAESFYRRRGERPVFQVFAGAGGRARATDARHGPPDLDASLAARGYVLEAPVSVQVAGAEAVAASALRSGAGVEVSLGRRLTDEWFDVSATKGRFAATASTYRALLERIGDRAVFALARDRASSAPIAEGLGVSGKGLFGLFSMSTLPAHRRRGAAAALVVALARAAVDAGQASLYLQVERENAGASSLYAAFGFRERYGYHYRVGPADLAAP